jgi:hypothetical protein
LFGLALAGTFVCIYVWKGLACSLFLVSPFYFAISPPPTPWFGAFLEPFPHYLFLVFCPSLVALARLRMHAVQIKLIIWKSCPEFGPLHILTAACLRESWSLEALLCGSYMVPRCCAKGGGGVFSSLAYFSCCRARTDQPPLIWSGSEPKQLVYLRRHGPTGPPARGRGYPRVGWGSVI